MYRRREGELRPIPPRGLRERNAVNSIAYWQQAVEEAAAPLDGLLAKVGTRVEDLDRVLDFGCGAGKVVASLRERGPHISCCDLHEPSIAWLRSTYPDVDAFVNDYDPPVERPDGSFDLVLAWSVLTHLDRDHQAKWLNDWARLVRPGGTVLATILGESAIPPDDAAAAARLVREGVVAIELAKTGAASSWFHGTEKPYFDTFNSRASLSEVIPAELELVEVVPRAVWQMQDCMVLRRR
jgi:SAM-dependent methyltransferase